MSAASSWAQVKLNSSTTPSQGQAGLSIIYVTGSGFPSGTILPASATASLAPAPPAVGPSATATAMSVKLIVGSTRRLEFQIPASLAPSMATPYLVTISGTTSGGTSFSSTNSASLEIIPAATISLSPNSGNTGTTVTVTITGTNAGFVQGSTEASFGPGTSVGGAAEGVLGPVTVTDPNSATAQVTIDPKATAGTQSVLVETGSEEIFSMFTVVSPAVLASCVPTSSLAVLIQGKNVISYVPNGAWDKSSTGLQVVPVEPTGTPASISTPNVVNSCSSNSVTGETVCTANNADVYLITGSTLNTTLTSGANGTAFFSGGVCNNCGVAINPVTNTAVIAMGLTLPSGGASGIQLLDLAHNTFATPIPGSVPVSEDISIDPNRNLVLSASESDTYELFQTAPTAAVFDNPVSGASGLFDSSAEDCTTGIALASDEFTGNIFISDLTQATFTPGSPFGTWSAPGQVQSFPEFAFPSAGTTGISVAPGSQLGIVTDEFGGNTFGAFQLPSTSGSGTPAISDWVVATIPADPSRTPWSFGTDPHTVTAYLSPNTGKAFGLAANGGFGTPTFLAVIDLQALLSAKRMSGSPHTIDPSVDLVAAGIITFVSTH